MNRRPVSPMRGTMYDYKIVAHEENDHIWSSCPDIPEAHSVGDSLEKLLANAVDGLTLALSIYVDQKRGFHLPTKPAITSCGFLA